MALSLDLNLLESGERFQKLCARLARREYPESIAISAGAWDGGRDILRFSDDQGDVVWQCKMTHRSLMELKPKLLDSLNALDPNRPIRKWILCVSIDGSGKFLDWLRDTIAKYEFISEWALWDRAEILQRLERNPDILEAFFWPVWKSLESKFRTDELELITFDVERGTGWEIRDAKVLACSQLTGANNDLVLDITVRNRGTLSTVINSARLEVNEVRRVLRGLPGAGLLWPQVTYSVSLNNGQPGNEARKLEPPLEVDGGKHARFQVRLTKTGFAWVGFVRLVLGYSTGKELALPWMLLAA